MRCVTRIHVLLLSRRGYLLGGCLTKETNRKRGNYSLRRGGWAESRASSGRAAFQLLAIVALLAPTIVMDAGVTVLRLRSVSADLGHVQHTSALCWYADSSRPRTRCFRTGSTGCTCFRGTSWQVGSRLAASASTARLHPLISLCSHLAPAALLGLIRAFFVVGFACER